MKFAEVGPKEVLARLRRAVRNSFNIHWTVHAEERMVERGVTTRQVMLALQKGGIDGDPVLEDGDWKITLVHRAAGRKTRVVAALSGDQVYIVTVI